MKPKPINEAEREVQKATVQNQEIKNQRPLVHNEIQWLDLLFRENNLAARLRKALQGG